MALSATKRCAGSHGGHPAAPGHWPRFPPRAVRLRAVAGVGLAPLCSDVGLIFLGTASQPLAFPSDAQHEVCGYDFLYPALPVTESLPLSLWLAATMEKDMRNSARIRAQFRAGPRPRERRNVPGEAHLSLAPEPRLTIILRGKVPSQSSVSIAVFSGGGGSYHRSAIETMKLLITKFLLQI